MVSLDRLSSLNTYNSAVATVVGRQNRITMGSIVSDNNPCHS